MTPTACPSRNRFSRLPWYRRWTVRVVSALVIWPVATRGQSAPSQGFVSVTDEAAERIRLSQLVGTSGTSGFLIRSVSRLTPIADAGNGWRIGVLTPEVHVIHNSALPFSLNDGPLWAGRGWNADVTGGVFARNGRVRVILAPTAIVEANREFQVIPFPQDTAHTRSIWANPFHPLPESIDLPLRFGEGQRRRIDAGQSSLTVDADVVSFGFATENLWWGPGIRNAITLSNNAAGFPHLFVQTRKPARTALGIFDAQWILGQLSESAFFDRDPTNNKRALSGLAMTWSPTSDSGLTLGLARLVMSARSNRDFPLGAAFDVLRSVGHADADTSTKPIARGRDQIFSLFGRWVFPGTGFEAYAEWARFEEPVSFRDLLEFPGHSQGYTLGGQWARPLAHGRTLRLQTEASYLEPDPSLRVRPVGTTYTSHAVPQGFTQRGKTLGAAIGPGASSQWLAGDLFAPKWRVGAYLSRIRWDNGVLFEPIVPDFKRQDVTLLAGVRGSVSWHGVDVLVDFAHAARFDYLFQAFVLDRNHTAGIDLLNNTLSVTLSTAFWPR